MDKRIIYSTGNGGLAVIIPAPECGLTIEEIVAKDVPAGVPFKIVDAADIPQDRTFRNAWADNGTISVDLSKAREIKRDQIRAQRAPLLTALDIEFMRASERGDNGAMAAIAARKQALRDATKDPAIEAAATPDELKAVTPKALQAG